MLRLRNKKEKRKGKKVIPVKTFRVVTCFIRHRGKLLLMKRGDKVRHYRSMWGTAAGYVEEHDKDILTRALTEIREETGLDERHVVLVRQGEPYYFVDKKISIRWHIHPFLFEAKTDSVKTDWEHTECRWINPEEFGNYETVPNLDESLKRVL
jgi:8-oxo-dGTP diphosphatase